MGERISEDLNLLSGQSPEWHQRFRRASVSALLWSLDEDKPEKSGRAGAEANRRLRTDAWGVSASGAVK